MVGDVIGREPELAILDRFLDSIPTGPSALLLSGEPGIGKTTVWKEGLAVPDDGGTERSRAVRSRRRRVSRTPPSVTSSSRSSRRRFQPCRSRSAGPSRWPSCAPRVRAPGPTSGPSPWPSSDAFGRWPPPPPSSWPSTTSNGWTFPRSGCSSSSSRRLKEDAVGLMTAARGTDPDEDPLGVAGALPEDRVHRVHVGPLSVDDDRTGDPRQGG